MLRNKKIAIYIAIANHYSLLDTILRSLCPLNCHITLFVSQQLAAGIKQNKQVTQIEIVSQTSFITRQQIKFLNQHNFVIFDELTSFKELLAFSFFTISVPKLLIIHDCNSWFKPVPPRGLKNNLKYQFTKILKRKFHVYAVAGTNMKRYISNTFFYENVFLIPFRYADFDESKDVTPVYEPGQRIRLCVPGTISARRDYYKILNELCVPQLKHKITLDVLGKAVGEYGKQIIELIKELKKQGFEIIFNEGFVNNDSFDASIKAAHVIFSDFEVEYLTNNGQHEVYGISKETGVAVLMWNKAKVGLLPANFTQMEEIENQTLFFKDAGQLADILTGIFEGTLKGFEKLQLNALTNARNMYLADITTEIENAYNIQINANGQ